MQKNATYDRRFPYAYVLLFFLFAAGIIASGYLNYRDYAQRFRSEIEKQLSAIADLKVSELVQWRKERLGDGSILFNNPSFSSLVLGYFENPQDTEHAGQLLIWLKRIYDYYQYNRISLFDSHGVRRLTLPDDAPGPPSSTLQQLIKEVLRSKKIVFQDFYINEHDQRIYLAVLVPVMDPHDAGRVLGVMVLRIDPHQYLFLFLKRWPTPSRTAETLLVRRDGDKALFLNELRFRQDTALKLRIPLRMINTPAVQAVLGHEGIIEGLDYRGVPVIADVRHIPDSPWFMIARMDTEEVYAPQQERLWLSVFFIIALIFCAGIGLLLIWRQQRVRFYREQLKNTEALAESRQLLLDITNNSLTLIYIFDTEGRFLLANRKFTDLLGTSPEKLTGRTRLEVMQRETADQHRANDLEVMRSRQLMIFEEENPEADGKHIYLTMKYPLFRADGTLYAVGGMSTDITDRKRAEEALRKSEEQFRAIAENTPDAIITTDIKGRICYCNRTAEKMFGYGQAELLGQFTSILLIEPLRDKEDANRENYLKNSDPAPFCVTSQAMAARKGGDTFPIEFPFFSWKAGEETFITAIMRDITARKRAEEALRESDAAVRRKLDALLEPEGDLGELSLSDIIDCQALQKIMEDFHRFSNLTSAVVDSSGNLLIAVGFQDICMQFHRVHPETRAYCTESDIELANGVTPGSFKTYKCKNSLWDMATPIEIGGRHMGNFYIGQFFYRDEVPDYEHFRGIARQYGFDENEYLAALDRVPRFDRETVEAAMAFYAKLSAMISTLSYSTVALGRALAQKDTAMDSLEKSEQRLLLALDAARMGVFDWRVPENQLIWSPQLEKQWGFAPGEFGGTYEAFAERVHPEDLPRVNAEIERSMAEKTRFNCEYRVLLPDRSTRWIMASGHFVCDTAGRPLRMYGVTMDITERVEAEKKMQLQSDLMDQAYDAIFAWEIDGPIMYWNKGAERLYGYSEAEAEGKFSHRLLHTIFPVSLEAQKETLRSTGVWEGELNHLTSGGERIRVDSRMILMRDEGRLIILESNRDITERKQMEEALKKQNIELTRFAYTMSHDLKSPLVTIKTFLGYLEKDMQKQDAGRIEKDFTYMRGAAEKMGRLLDELLDLTRIGRIETPEMIAPLQDIVQDALVLVAGRIAQRGVKVEVTQKPLLLRGDRVRLVEVFQNLIDNAVQFMGDQKEPKVEIGLTIKNSEKLLFVRDNGMGIDPRHMDKLFGLFEKLDAATEGTGMGLALVKRIVEVHGGRIWVESEGPGKGACFWLTLPGKQG